MEENERTEEKNSNIVTDEVWSWGAGTEGQLATSKLHDENMPQVVTSLCFTGKPISHLACGGAHVIALSKDDGKVLTWGRGTSGQLGHGENKNCLYPLPVKLLQSFVISYVSAGWNHSGFVSSLSLSLLFLKMCLSNSLFSFSSKYMLMNLFFKDTGRVFTCGDGTFGQLGHGDYQSQCAPKEVLYFESKHVEQIACGMRHTLVLLKGHSRNLLYGFGVGKRGQLGVYKDMKKRSLNLPQIVEGLEEVDIATIIANGDQSAILTVGGNLYTWGKGFHGKPDTQHPILFSSPLKFTQIALGWNHALVLTDYGKVFMLGGNHHGMLSAPPKTCLKRCSSKHNTPCKDLEDDSKIPTLVEVPGLDGVAVVDIAAGSEHSAIITESGDIMTWGWGEHGQLGLGNEEDRISPQIVSVGPKLSTDGTQFNIHCGSGFTYAIRRGFQAS